MTRAAVLLVSLSLLVECASGARDVKLTDRDLSDMGTVGEIRAQLNAEDGAAFANYVLKLLETISEALYLALARDAKERGALEEANKTKHPRDLAQQRWGDSNSEKVVTREGILA